MKLFKRTRKVNDSGSDEPGTIWAGFAAGAILAAYGHTVTYSVEDLVQVDQAIADLVEGAEDKGSINRTIYAFGCLIGEILVRNDGGRWVILDAESAAVFDVAMVVEMPDGRRVNAIGAASKRAILGEESSVVLFRDHVLGPLDGPQLHRRN